jgi:cysteine desulfurase
LPRRDGAENVRIQACTTACWQASRDIEQVFINGHETQRVPHNLNMSFNYVEGESLIMGIKGLAVSSGSACTSAAWSPAMCCAPWAAVTSWPTAACA